MVPGAGRVLVGVLSAGPHDFQAGTGGSRRRAGEALMSGHTHHTPGVVMFVMNDLLNDPRVQREARSAVLAGFRVTVVAMQSDRCRVPRQTVDGYEIVRVRLLRFGIMYAVVRVWRLVVLAGLVLREGVNLAVGPHPRPGTPGQTARTPTRVRRLNVAPCRGDMDQIFAVEAFRTCSQGLGHKT